MLRLLAPAMLLGLLAWAAAPAAASHIACGDELTHDTTLDADLVDCPGNGVSLHADGITLDLNGHTIDGSGVEGGIVDWGSGNTIRDGVVRDFSVGLFAGGSDGTARRIAISANGVGFEIAATGTRVEHNRISNNRERGVLLTDAGDNVIRKNVITGNGAGVGLVWSTGNRIEQNEVGANLGDGVHIVGEEGGVNGNVIEANVTSANGDDGIDIDDQVVYPPLDNVITRNIANDNGDLGIVAGAGNIDGGGNRAFGNGNPLQCIGITCK